MAITKKSVSYKGKLLALIFSKDLQTDSIEFLTPVSYPIQIGLLQHKEGKFVGLHFHNNFNYKVNTTHEILYVEKGKIDVVITNNKWTPIHTQTLTRGDMVLLIDGGHSVNLHKGSRVWEIKQGPYPGDNVAKVFKENWDGDIPEIKKCIETSK